MSAAEIPHHIFFSVTSLLVSDNDTALGIEHGQSARHRFVIGKPTVAVQFGPTRETALDVIEREGTLDMPRDLDPLPRAQVAINLASGFAELRFDRFDFRIEIDVMLAGMLFQILQASFELEDPLFKI